MHVYGRAPLWSERLGLEFAEYSLAWLDEQAEQVRWLRDDLRHASIPVFVAGETGTEIWVWDRDEQQSYLSRLEPSTGELLERVVWTTHRPTRVAAAWPDQGGVWLLTLESYDETAQVYVLQRMASFAELGPVLRSFEADVDLQDGSTFWAAPPRLDPTPGGGLLFGGPEQVESLAEDGSQRWVIDQAHGFRVVDQHGGFLLGNVFDGAADDQRSGLSIQRRALADGSLLWSRVHHRYQFVGEPEPDEWLSDLAWSYAARAEGGYLLAGTHAYPASSCPWQPIVWAIDLDGEVEWAHRIEACGSSFIPSERVDARALVLGLSYTNGDGSNGNIEASWLQYFDL